LLQESKIHSCLETEELNEFESEEESVDQDRADQMGDLLHLMDQHDTWVRNTMNSEWRSQGHEMYRNLIKNRKDHVSVSEIQEFWAKIVKNSPRIILELNFGVDSYSSLTASQNLQKYQIEFKPFR